MADGLKTSISTNRQNGKCFADSTSTSAKTEDKLIGKYGTAEILQAGGTTTGGTTTGGNATALVCGIKYTFNKAGVSDKLTSKTITLKVTEDSILKLEAVGSNSTNVENKYLPSAFR